MIRISATLPFLWILLFLQVVAPPRLTHALNKTSSDFCRKHAYGVASIPERRFAAYYDVFRVGPSPDLRRQLQAGQITLPPHKTVHVRSDLWSDLHVPDLNWRYQFQTLRFLRPLLSSPDSLDRLEALRWVRSWSNAHPTIDETLPTLAWDKHATAFRAHVIAQAYSQFTSEKRSVPDLRQELVRHAQFLADSRNFELTNHGLNESLALLELAQLLITFSPPSPSSSLDPYSLRDLAIERFEHIVDLSVSPLGLHLEHSPTYHGLFFTWMTEGLYYMRVLACLDSTFPLRLARLEEQALAMQSACNYLVDLSGHWPPIGDSEVASATLQTRAAFQRLGRLGLRSPKPPPSSVSVLFDSVAGYAIFKQSRRDRSRYGVFNIQRSRPLAHVHNDALALYFQVDSVVVFTDSGKYSYNEGDKFRQYMVDRMAHNTVDPLAGSPYVLAADARNLSKQGSTGFRAIINGPGDPFTHQRTVWFPDSSRELLRVVDEVRSPNGVSLRWHLGSAMRTNHVEYREGGFGIEIRDPDHGLAISIVCNRPLDWKVVHGQTDPDPLGWYSPTWGKLQPISVVVGRTEQSAAQHEDSWEITTVVVSAKAKP